MRGLVLKLIRRRRLERDLETELAFHEDMSRADGNEIRLGNRVRVKEQARDVWRWWLVEELWRNLRHGARQLVRSAAFSSAAVLTLGLAVGATAAIFTLVHRVVLNPLPYSRSDRLVQLDHGSLAFNVPTGLGMKAGLYQYYSERATTLEAVAIYTTGAATLAGRGEPERVRVTRATPTLSAVLGVEPELGRWLTEAEGVPGAPSTAVISHGLWSRRYGNATDVIGRTLNLDGVATTIVGVMSAGYAFPDAGVDVWLPEPLEPGTGLGLWSYAGVARMREGVRIAAVRGEMEALIADVGQAFPDDPLARATGPEVGVMPTPTTLKEATIGDVDDALWILLAAVGIVMLVASANVANLFLVRAEVRGREVAIRRAIGAGRAAVGRLFMAEAVLLSSVGAALGLALAWSGVELLVAAAPPSLPRLEEIRVDAVVVGFTLTLGVLSALGFTAVQLWRSVPRDSSLVHGGRRATAGPERRRIRQLLMGGQVALALVLLISSGLLTRSFQQLRAIEPGFASEGGLTFGLGLPERDYPDKDSALAAHLAILAELRAEPDIAAASASTCFPLDGVCFGNGVVVQGREGRVPTEADIGSTAFRAVAGGYFETMGIRLLRGRGIDRADVERGEPIAVIDERLADLVFPGEDPLGRRISGSLPPPEGEQIPRLTWLTIVGVVGATPVRALGEAAPPAQLYMPMSLTGEFDAPSWEYIGPRVAAMGYVVRPSAPSVALLPAIRRAVNRVDAGLAIAGINTLDDRLARASAQPAFTMTLIVIAASIALVLGLIGIYGVVSYIVSQRENEIGVRIALGAAPSRVAAMIVRQGGIVTLAGIALGLMAALAGGRLIEALLYDVSPRDPLVFLVTTLGLLAVAILACWLPARRAARIDPVEALRPD